VSRSKAEHCLCTNPTLCRAHSPHGYGPYSWPLAATNIPFEAFLEVFNPPLVACKMTLSSAVCLRRGRQASGSDLHRRL
jgi:hypothetical protein